MSINVARVSAAHIDAMTFENLYTSAMPAAGADHAESLKHFMDEVNIDVMGLVEAHGDGFKDALKSEFGKTKCKDSTCNQKKECFLVSRDEEWRVGDTECDRFNVAIKELLRKLPVESENQQLKLLKKNAKHMQRRVEILEDEKKNKNYRLNKLKSTISRLKIPQKRKLYKSKENELKKEIENIDKLLESNKTRIKSNKKLQDLREQKIKQLASSQRLQNLKCAVAGRRVNDPVVYVVAYADSGLKTKEQMSFLTEINAQLEAAFRTAIQNLPVVLMGDWNTTTPEARGGVTEIMELKYQEHSIFRPTTKKKRTLCQAQTHKSLTVDTGTKDYIFLSKHVDFRQIGGTLIPDRYYVSNSSTYHQLDADIDISFLPSRKHFSDHVAVVQHWESGANTHRVATLNCMSEPYNSLAFYDQDPASVSNKVNAALEAKMYISKTLFLQHINTLLSCDVGNDFTSSLRTLKNDIQIYEHLVLPFWYIFIPPSEWAKCSSLQELQNFKKARILVKQYSFAMDYRPDLVNFQHYKGAGIRTAQEALQVFQDCVDADDSSFDAMLQKWVSNMCLSIENYKTKWDLYGKYKHRDGYTVDRAKHIATCLLMGLWMIDSLRNYVHHDAHNAFAHVRREFHLRFV